MHADTFLNVYNLVRPWLPCVERPVAPATKFVPSECFKRGTILLLADGTRKLVENIGVEDTLLGDDGTPRKVLATTSGREKLFRVSLGESKNNPLFVTGSHLLVLRRNRVDRTGVDLPKEADQFAKKVGTGLEPDPSAGNALRQGNFYYFADEASLKSGVISHVLSLPRTAKAKTRLTNALTGNTGIRVRSQVSISFKKTIKKKEHTKTWYWGQSTTAATEKASRKTSEPGWESVRVADEAEAWQTAREFIKARGWMRDSSLDLVKIKKDLLKHLKGQAERAEPYSIGVKAVEGLYAQFVNNDTSTPMRFKYTYMDNSEREGGEKQADGSGDHESDDGEEEEEEQGGEGDQAETSGRKEYNYAGRTHFYYSIDPSLFDSSASQDSMDQSDEDRDQPDAETFLRRCKEVGGEVRIDPLAKEKIVELSVDDVRKMNPDERKKWWLFSPDGLSFGFDDLDEEGVQALFDALPVDAYFLGLWLGDGTENYVDVANNHEEEILDFLARYAETQSMKLTHTEGTLAYRIVSLTKEEKKAQRAKMAEAEEEDQLTGSEGSNRVRDNHAEFVVPAASDSSSSGITYDDVDADGNKIFVNNKGARRAIDQEESEDRMSISERNARPGRGEEDMPDLDDSAEDEEENDESGPSTPKVYRKPSLQAPRREREHSPSPSSRRSKMSIDELSSSLGKLHYDQRRGVVQSDASFAERPANTRRPLPIIMDSSPCSTAPNFSPVEAVSRIPSPTKVAVPELPQVKAWSGGGGGASGGGGSNPFVSSADDPLAGMTAAERRAVQVLSVPSSQVGRNEHLAQGVAPVDPSALVAADVAQAAAEALAAELAAAREFLPLAAAGESSSHELENQELEEEEEEEIEAITGEGSRDFQGLAGVRLTDRQVAGLIDEVLGEIEPEQVGSEKSEEEAEDDILSSSDEIFSIREDPNDGVYEKGMKQRRRGRINKLHDALRRLGLSPKIGEDRSKGSHRKHIPEMYKFAPRKVRLAVLAGLIDSDGYYKYRTYDNITYRSFEFSQARYSHETLFWDTVFIARSLGYRVSVTVKKERTATGPTGRRIFGHEALNASITGNIEEVPTLLPRKQVSERVGYGGDNKVFKFSITEEEEESEYFGFKVDGNGRFLRHDMIILRDSTFESPGENVDDD